jgi:hypothetical protein
MCKAHGKIYTLPVSRIGLPHRKRPKIAVENRAGERETLRAVKVRAKNFLRLIDRTQYEKGREVLVHVVNMLTKLAKTNE